MSHIKIQQDKEGNEAVYCDKCKCYMSSTTLTNEELKTVLDKSKSHEHRR